MKFIRLNKLKQKGLVVVITAISIFALVGIVALATETGQLVLNKTRIQNIADSAALTGAKALFDSNNIVIAEEAARNRIIDLQDEMDVTGNFNVKITFLKALNPRSIANNNSDKPKYIEVTLSSGELPKFLGTIFGDEWKKNVDAVATAGRAATKPGNNSPECPLDNSSVNVVMCSDEQTSSDGSFGYGLNTIFRLHIAEPNICTESEGNIHSLLYKGCPKIGETIKTDSGDQTEEISNKINSLFSPNDNQIIPDLVAVDSRNPISGYEKYTLYNFDQKINGYKYANYLTDLTTCSADPSSAKCNVNGKSRARILRVALGNCSGSGYHGGKASVQIKGYGCMFLPQTVGNEGMDGQVFGEFVDQAACDSLFAGGINTNPNSASPGKFVLFK